MNEAQLIVTVNMRWVLLKWHTLLQNPPAYAGGARDTGSVSGSGRSPGGGNGNPLQLFLPGESPRTEEPGGLQSMGLQRVRHN